MSITRTSPVLLGIACALVLAIAAPAFADKEPSEKDKATASARFKKAVELYKSGDVRAALIEFRRAYKLAPTFRLLFNIGQASAELRDYVDAYNSFTQYLEDGGDNISDERREMVERELERLKGYLARLEMSVSVDGAEVTIDGVVVGTSPLSEPLLVSAGRRQIVVTREGHARWERSVDLAGEDEQSLEVTLISLATDTPDKTETVVRRRGLGAGFWVATGLTVVLGAGTSVAGYLTLQAQGEREAALATVPASQTAIDDAVDKSRRMALLTDIGIGLTAAAGIVTLVLAIRGGGEVRVPVEKAQSVHVLLSPTGLALVGRF